MNHCLYFKTFRYLELDLHSIQSHHVPNTAKEPPNDCDHLGARLIKLFFR